MSRVMDAGLASWINSLPHGTCESMYRLLTETVKTHNESGVVGEEEVLSTYDNIRAPDRNGAWYSSLVRCLVVEFSFVTGHPRWQVSIRGGGHDSQPGIGSMGDKLRSRMSVDRWDALRSVVNGRQVKFQVHHVAYAAGAAMLSVPLPENAGSGGSVSHLCDRLGCIRPDHLEATPRHADNMSRQRCPGILLLIYLGEIILEKPCQHGADRSLTLQRQIEKSCRKVFFWELSDVEAGRVHALFEALMDNVFADCDDDDNSQVVQQLSSQLDTPVEHVESGLSRMRRRVENDM